MDNDQTEITRLRKEIARLQKQLEARQASSVPVRSDTASLLQNHELIQDLARYCEGIVTERNVRQKHKLSESTWTALGSDEPFIQAIKRERERRVRNGATARERAQKLFTETPEVLGNILNDDEMSARHRIEAAREIRAVAATGPEVHSTTEERYVIQINIGDDYKLKIDQPIRPTIDSTTIPMLEEDDGAEPI
jgi:preprotein translocase subunit SecD